MQEAAVIGVPDSYRGEALRAYVVFRPGVAATEEDLSAHLRERLTKYKNPREICIRPTLPKTSVGKIDKNRLRSESEDRVRGNVDSTS